MGMFDSIMVKCPECGKEVEFQSKSGACCCDYTTLEEAIQTQDAAILGLNTQKEKCKCGRELELRLRYDVEVLTRKIKG